MIDSKFVLAVVVDIKVLVSQMLVMDPGRLYNLCCFGHMGQHSRNS